MLNSTLAARAAARRQLESDMAEMTDSLPIGSDGRGSLQLPECTSDFISQCGTSCVPTT